MAILFNEKKATQAAAQFLSLAGGKMNYMLLIKLLYLLDRGALLRWGRLVTYDTFFEMKLGPVLSQVHDLITEGSFPEEQRFWPEFISDASNHEVLLKHDPGDGELSEAEEELIKELFAVYGRWDPFKLARKLHEILPELKGIQQGRLEITVADILHGESRPADEIKSVVEGIESHCRVESLFSYSGG